MKKILPYYRSICTISLIGLSVFFFAQCIHIDNESVNSGKNIFVKQFAGSAACAKCHKNIYDSHIHTAHYLTTRVAEKQFIKGSFNKGSNQFAYNEKRDSSFYQVGYKNGIEKSPGVLIL
jgi:hypothetical protein